jgi:8-oxo-dGTP pyrophosphatase MutT (NUDIX family)
MMLTSIGALLKHRLNLPLPGREAQFRMAHAERRINLSKYKIPQDTKWGSVLILLFEEDQRIKLPLILRPEYNGVHSGQIGFPGGKFEPGDENLVATALRETFEEIGVPVEDVEVIGKLTELYIPPSNFLVYPHVGFVRNKPVFSPDSNEVVKVIEISIDELMDESLVGEKEITLGNGLKIVTPYFDFGGYTVWGATAMIISEFKTILREIAG